MKLLIADPLPDAPSARQLFKRMRVIFERAVKSLIETRIQTLV
jgi:hypothetical protein